MQDVAVLVADDHPVVRHRVAELITAEPGFAVVAEAADGTQTMASARRHGPGLVVLDLRLPDMSGHEVLQNLQQLPSTPRVVVFTLDSSAVALRSAIDAGATGYVLKSSHETELLACIRAVSTGQRHVDAAVAWKLGRAPPPKPTGPLARLTTAERGVLEHVSTLATNREIATRLGLSIRTIEKHRDNIAQKLGLHGDHAVLKFALEHIDQL